MAEMTDQELKQLLEKLFVINSKDSSFFEKCLHEIAETDSGARLLRSLEKNFKGDKFTLKRRTYQEIQKDLNIKVTQIEGYCSDDICEIWIGKPNSLKDVVIQKLSPSGGENYSKILFHELTHLEQFQKGASGGNANTEADKFFTVLVSEADAQALGDLFEIEQDERRGIDWGKWLLIPAQQLHRFIAKKLNSNRRFIVSTKKKLISHHPDWSVEKIEKETQKLFFEKVLTTKDSHWRKYYEHPSMMAEATSGVHSKRDFADVMKYYIDKYGLTLKECLELKKEILAQSNPKLSEPAKTDRNTILAQTSHRPQVSKGNSFVQKKTKVGRISVPQTKCVNSKKQRTVFMCSSRGGDQRK